jgi:WhiB family redox-sensing transcriptional regulator
VTIVDVAFAETLSLMQPGDADDVDLFASLLQRPSWMAEGACRSGRAGGANESPDAERPAVNFFPGRGESAAPAKAVCRTCPVSDTCLAFAMDHDAVGIWGGTSERQRRRLLAGSPWAELSDDQRQAVVARALAPRPAKPTKARTPCEHCGEMVTGRYCNQRCRNAASYYRRRSAPARTGGDVADVEEDNGSSAPDDMRELRERLGMDAAEARVARAFAALRSPDLD